MSALIHHFVVHRLIVNDEGKINAVPRESCLTVTPEIEQLAHQINHSFNAKPGKGVGHFIAQSQQGESDESQDISGFSTSLSEFLSAQKNNESEVASTFHQFSVQATDKLIKALVDTGSVETGFLIFCQYEFLATQYLMITLLNTRAHVEVNQALELTSREHLDLARMQLAVRIDLTQWQIQPEQQRYISFIKGRMGRKVSDFFMEFIGCEELVDVKQQNKQLVATVDAYLASEQLDQQEQEGHRQEVKAYFKEKIDSGETLSIAELSARLPSDEQTQRDFAAYTELLETPLEKDIQPDPAALRQLAKYTGQGGGVSLSFERKLLGDRIIFDAASDTLIIKGVPPNLKDQLVRQSKGPQ
ncbi:nucleoid-associated protein YejK [Alteromonas aestuariivivens]|uniref:Nucleoid-associated protein YejK n=1 Tax=Alteromonas aestuariivivens TaxID=1938339 RepID=A0A3D8M8N8_9ALTE|nr:nucleoid-associated protein YejK [Alteromonas aestuariivivens]RDV26023.1 nucleoid-associated protein YejK [Alteromonas aestuariivivens]